jgi:endogenous inhibitor of DNA gyrase (YacG/DUF329 family)
LKFKICVKDWSENPFCEERAKRLQRKAWAEGNAQIILKSLAIGKAQIIIKILLKAKVFKTL